MDLRVDIRIRSRVDADIEDLSRRLARAGRMMVSSTQRKILTGTFEPNAQLTVELKKGGDRPLRDTGALLASITSRVEGSSAIVGTNRAGARINQFGGTIIATGRSGRLWIPANRHVKAELASMGGSIGRLIRSYKSKGWWCSRSKSGKAFIAIRDKEVKTLFILKTQVTIPARPFLYFDDKDKEMIDGVFSGFVEKGL